MRQNLPAPVVTEPLIDAIDQLQQRALVLKPAYSWSAAHRYHCQAAVTLLCHDVQTRIHVNNIASHTGRAAAHQERDDAPDFTDINQTLTR